MIDTGDTAFVLVSAALVLLMTPALAFFYGGLVRRKNVINTMMMSIVMMAVCGIMWMLFGYSLSFSGDNGGIIGGLSNVFLSGLPEISEYADTLPSYAYVGFQMMFAILTPALLTGSVAGRMRFKALFFFIILWSLIVYYPLAHMVWGHGGLLGEGLGSVDFAGGNVVHISSGLSGLTLALLIGRRKGVPRISYRVHNIPFVVLGAMLLWFGWLGFNAGSALGANGLAAHAFMTTNIAASAAMLSWMFIDIKIQGKPTAVGLSTGAVLGLVAITPGAGFVPIWAALLIGLTISPIAYFMVSVIKKKIGYDDALDAFGCHGVGGIWGGIMVGVFGQSAINPVAQWDGLFFGATQLFTAQVLAVIASICVSVVGTFICAKVVGIFTPLRATESEEKIGLDRTLHGEEAYPAFNGLD